jgi:replicative DNA helicase
MASFAQLKDLQGMPSSPHSEIAILGAMLLETSAVSEVIGKLDDSDFSMRSHQQIYCRMVEMHREGQPIDPITLGEWLYKHRELDAVGGRDYLYRLCEGIPRNLNVSSYIAQVKDKALARRVISLSQIASDAASGQQEDGRAILQKLVDGARELLDDTEGHDLQRVGEYFAGQNEQSFFEKLSTPDGLMLGWTQWDELLGGLQRKELLILAANASTGKTAWACNAVHHTSVIGNKVTAFFPLEQKIPSAVRRILSSTTHINFRDIRDGNLRQYERDLLIEHRRRLEEAPLYMDDSPDMTMSRIKAKCGRLKRHMLAQGHPTGLDFVLIDQLSHTDNSDVWQKGLSMEELIGRQGHEAKKMADELDVPVCLLGQMTQEGAKRTDPMPRLTDLAGSGRIKNHADIVAFLHRPEMYDKAEELKGLGQFVIVKNRDGATGVLDLKYMGHILKWVDETVPKPKQEAFTSSGYNDW